AQTWASGTLSLSRSRTHVARVQFCGRGVETGSALGWELPLSSAQLGPANSIDCTLRETEAWYHLAKGGRDVKGGQSSHHRRVMSRTVLWLMAGGAAVIAAAVGVVWHGELSEPTILGQATKPAGDPAPAPSQLGLPAVPRPAAPEVAGPSFDVARIRPDGGAVIAGRAQPGAKIVLLDGGKEIAQGQADANGEWVIIAQNPPLSAGQHELRVIQHVEGRAPVTSDQVVVAVVPDQTKPETPASAEEG